jgi:hypothetical protein
MIQIRQRQTAASINGDRFCTTVRLRHVSQLVPQDVIALWRSRRVLVAAEENVAAYGERGRAKALGPGCGRRISVKPGPIRACLIRRSRIGEHAPGRIESLIAVGGSPGLFLRGSVSCATAALVASAALRARLLRNRRPRFGGG